MKKRPFASLLLAAALMSGCGSTDSAAFTGSSSNAGPSPNQFSLSGRILSETGQGQSGVRIIANERTTDAKVETTSGPDGSYQFSLPAGVYDLGLDRSGDSQTATCFYGPVTGEGGLQHDWVLRQSNGKPAGHVSGKLWLRHGVPASNRKVNLRSAHLPDPKAPPSLSTTTTSDGSFEQLLSSDRELGLDVEVFDSVGNFDEFIDIGKLSKPAYVEFLTDLPVATNRLRSDETDPPVQSSLLAKAGDFTLFNHLESRSDPGGGPNMLLFTEGLLPVDKTEHQFFDGIMTPSLQLQFNAYRGWVASGPIRVDKNGSWWWDYAVNVKPDRSSYFQFEDETTDVYKLSVVVTSYWHKVSYNSAKPNIQAIATVDPTSTSP